MKYCALSCSWYLPLEIQLQIGFRELLQKKMEYEVKKMEVEVKPWAMLDFFTLNNAGYFSDQP